VDSAEEDDESVYIYIWLFAQYFFNAFLINDI
jgi:hypothetical protein